MANRWTRTLASAAVAATVVGPIVLAAGPTVEARPQAPLTTCSSPAPCAAPWMGYLTNLTVGRAPTDADYGTHSPSTDLTQAQRTAIATKLLTSLEGRRFTVELYYWRDLGRAPDPSGADFWPRAMVDGRRNTELLEASLIGSSEFARKWPDWITQMYSVVLARQPDPQGYAYWTEQATRQSHERVARRFAASAAARRARAALLYGALYAHPSLPITSDQLAAAADRLGHVTGEDELIIEITSSDSVYDALQST